MTETIFADLAAFVRAPRLTGLQTSRSGKTILTRRTIDEDGAAFVDQLFEVGKDTARQITFGKTSANLLAVGQRGEVYFSRQALADDSKDEVLWMLPPVGEAREIFRYRGSIQSLQVTDSSLLIILSVFADVFDNAKSVNEGLAASGQLAKKRDDNKVTAVLHGRFPIRYWDHDLGPEDSRLFVSPLPDLEAPLDLEMVKTDKTDKTKDNAKLQPSELVMTEVLLPPRPKNTDQWELDEALAVPDGSKVLVTMGSRKGIIETRESWLVDPTNVREPQLLASGPDEDFSAVAVSPDGSWAAMLHQVPPLPSQTIDERTSRFDLRAGKSVTLDIGPWTSLIVGEDDNIYFTADRAGRGGVYVVSKDGKQTLLTPDDEYAYSSLGWANGDLVAFRSSIAEPAAVVFIDPSTGNVTEGPRLTPDFELPGELSEVLSVAADGTPLHAWLATPDSEGPHPLVVFAHGGPWGSWNDWTWRWNPWAAVARGYAVLLPDPGISTGYGSAMLSRGHDALGDEPFTDIMTLTDAVIVRDDIDEARQLFAGGSYGGYMANWVAGHTADRFKAIITHASVWNVESMSRTTDNASWYRWMMGPVPDGVHAGAPQAELWSPHRFIEDIQVPMLAIHGDRDYRVPFSQGLELWMDLQRTSPELCHQYLYFPDEGHWILKPGNAQVWYETFLAFLDQHASGGEFRKPELLG